MSSKWSFLAIASLAALLMWNGYARMAHAIHATRSGNAEGYHRAPVLLSDEQLALFWGGTTPGKCRLSTGATAFGCLGVDPSCSAAGACPGGPCSDCNPILRNSFCDTTAATGTSCIGSKTLKCNALMPVTLSGSCVAVFGTTACSCAAQSGTVGCGTFAGCP